MKNYAGHRLSPWLGHLMISRSETSRPLLTQGEILQLPDTDEIVMLSGAPPIRAKKARYYTDPRLQHRIQAPPKLNADRKTELPGDDWSNVPTPKTAQASEHSAGRAEAGANGGVRREPELPPHVEIARAAPQVANEFEFRDATDIDGDAAGSERLRARMVANARRASLDPTDGIEL